MMKYTPLLLTLILISCSPPKAEQAMICRKATKIDEEYRVNFVLDFKSNTPLVSTYPLKCLNVQVTFHGAEANSKLVEMMKISSSSKSKSTLYNISAIGSVKEDGELGIPVFQVRHVYLLNNIY